MPEYQLHTTVHAGDPGDIFRRVTNFERYPELAPQSIRSLRVTNDANGAMSSEWAVRFHGGTLKWRETDHIDDKALRLEFRQVAGDLDEFTGSWQVVPHDNRTVVVSLHARFDLGMPAVADALDPMALQAFDETMRGLISELLGDHVIDFSDEQR